MHISALLMLLAAADPTTDDEKSLYAIGLMMSQNLDPLGLTDAEVQVVLQGIADGAMKKPEKVKREEWVPRVPAFAQARAGKAAEATKARGKAFLDGEAKKKGAKKTASGLVYQETRKGSGDMPKPTDVVTVQYTGTLMDGRVFDTSRDDPSPAKFPLNGVIPCWTEGVGMMKKGGTARLVCPSDLAYGDQGAPPDILPGATLIFDVELIDVTPSK